MDIFFVAIRRVHAVDCQDPPYTFERRAKFLPENAKAAPEKSQRSRKSAAEFSADLPKNGRKGAELF
jgi:hypothetical protein